VYKLFSLDMAQTISNTMAILANLFPLLSISLTRDTVKFMKSSVKADVSSKSRELPKTLSGNMGTSDTTCK
jgi:hypothetical protein